MTLAEAFRRLKVADTLRITFELTLPEETTAYLRRINGRDFIIPPDHVSILAGINPRPRPFTIDFYIHREPSIIWFKLVCERYVKDVEIIRTKPVIAEGSVITFDGKHFSSQPRP